MKEPKDKILDKIRNIIQEDVGKRGLRTVPGRNLITACQNDFSAACMSLASTDKPSLAIVTGFWIPTAQPPAGETDGPLGAVFLARALIPLGFRVVMATDTFCSVALKAGLQACGLEQQVPIIMLPNYAQSLKVGPALCWQAFQRRSGPLTHLLAIERVGPSHSKEGQPADRCYTMRGVDITDKMSPAHWLFEMASTTEGITTIGIGDGGNEIGMGKIDADIIRTNIQLGDLIACSVPTDRLIVAGVSNWGAYGLAAGVRVLKDKPLDDGLFKSDFERTVLQAMVEKGPLVDGVTGKPTVTVDGLDFATYAKVLDSIARSETATPEPVAVPKAAPAPVAAAKPVAPAPAVVAAPPVAPAKPVAPAPAVAAPAVPKPAVAAPAPAVVAAPPVAPAKPIAPPAPPVVAPPVATPKPAAPVPAPAVVAPTVVAAAPPVAAPKPVPPAPVPAVVAPPVVAPKPAPPAAPAPTVVVAAPAPVAKPATPAPAAVAVAAPVPPVAPVPAVVVAAPAPVAAPVVAAPVPAAPVDPVVVAAPPVVAKPVAEPVPDIFAEIFNSDEPVTDAEPVAAEPVDAVEEFADAEPVEEEIATIDAEVVEDVEPIMLTEAEPVDLAEPETVEVVEAEEIAVAEEIAMAESDSTPAHEPLSPAAEVRKQARRGELTGSTAGLAMGHVQANLVVVPRDLAFDFLLFCQRNPKACPLLDVTEPGSFEPRLIAPGADVRTDLPAYRVYRQGKLASEPTDISDLWQKDWVAFLLGCSFTFESALQWARIPVRHIEAGCNVPMYRTSIACEPAGVFRGPMVVSMRPMTPAQAIRAVQVTSRFPRAHGAPIHIGDPSAIGIDDLNSPDFGDAVEVRSGEVPVFWPCGVTPQAVAMEAKLPIMVTHKPGCMFVTDLLDTDLEG